MSACLSVSVSPPLATGTRSAGNFCCNVTHPSNIWGGQVTCDRWQETYDRLQVTRHTGHTFLAPIIFYWGYYPHTSRDSVSSVCGVLFKGHQQIWYNLFFYFSISSFQERPNSPKEKLYKLKIVIQTKIHVQKQRVHWSFFKKKYPFRYSSLYYSSIQHKDKPGNLNIKLMRKNINTKSLNKGTKVAL